MGDLAKKRRLGAAVTRLRQVFPEEKVGSLEMRKAEVMGEGGRREGGREVAFRTLPRKGEWQKEEMEEEEKKKNEEEEEQEEEVL